jgi:hypothetical protein
VSYIALRFDIDADAADALADALLDAGALSVDGADPHATPPPKRRFTANPAKRPPACGRSPG